ncbi:type II toxin-antitoxin system prevent-host-death family antitoxin [Azospirillum rugosum]|uniref:DNA-binding protein n=1 Tax=Azospirillum rugosum TaxID=416170 RepID=A0ABS4SRH7_9PROT|nr:type II toxin-antitoxin system prevent-host-death family antitoxin [Azospirillum rugosum]MBP2295171.1 putative DNA-binding protein [Azospirillum rugosum]MDQ0528545.1 putative DNA-binding protein [Azospirillum rugosum]
MSAIRLPIEVEQRLQSLARQTGQSEADVLREALDAYWRNSARRPDEDRGAAHARLMERLKSGWDLGGGRFDRDSLYDR